VKQWLKRITPSQAQVREHRQLRVFGKRLQHPALWHFNRRSVTGAFAIGMFVMYRRHRGPLPSASISPSLSLWSGSPTRSLYCPCTTSRIWWGFEYSGRRCRPSTWSIGWNGELARRPRPLTIGSLVCGAIGSTLGYLAVQAAWRWNLVRRIRLRRMRYCTATSGFSSPSSKRQT